MLLHTKGNKNQKIFTRLIFPILIFVFFFTSCAYYSQPSPRLGARVIIDPDNCSVDEIKVNGMRVFGNSFYVRVGEEASITFQAKHYTNEGYWHSDYVYNWEPSSASNRLAININFNFEEKFSSNLEINGGSIRLGN